MRLRGAKAECIRWLLATRDLSPHTIRAYESDIAAFERYFGSQASVEEIDGHAIVAFVEEQRGTGVGSRSIRRRASALRGFCSWLQSRGQLPADPWLGTTLRL